MARPNQDRPVMTPTDPRSRITSVDMVRGFALFGVLLVNMFNFGAYSDEWTGGVDRFFFWTMHAFFETKSWRLFSMLFGFGFYLMMEKAARYDGNFMIVYVRRLALLFIIGMGHALLYDGDILMEYAILGVVLIPFRRMPPRVTLILAIGLMSAFPVGNAWVAATDVDATMEDEDAIGLSERRQDHPYLGSAADVITANAEAIPPNVFSGLHNPESSLAIFAMFLLGLFVGRTGVLRDIPGHLPRIRKVMRTGLIVGTLCLIGETVLTQYFGYAVFRHYDAPLAIQIVGDSLFAFGSTALSLGYAGTIIVLAHKDAWRAFLTPLAKLGRLALTVYLSGSLLFTLLFYGYGFGQIFLLGPAATTAWAVVFFAIQIAFCTVWTKHFRFGPFEWVWRSLTYLRMPQMARK